MLLKFIQAYSDFFDNRISDSTLVVGMISVLIVCVGALASHDKTQAYKASLIESQITTTPEFPTIITINGKKYKIILEEIK